VTVFAFAARWADFLEKLVPGVDLQDPEVRGAVAMLEDRDLQLESRLSQVPIPPFCLAGAVVASVSVPWSAPYETGVSWVRLMLGTAGSTATTVDVLVGGVVGASVSIGSSATVVDALVAVRVPADAVLRVEVTSAGAGATDLTVVLGS
jgi:hypothetical protein